MKLISWNVNGIRAVLGKNFWEFFKTHEPDILCLQETKAHPDQVNIEIPSGYSAYWNSAIKKGYSGTAIFTRHKPKEVSYGIGLDKHDQEGRVITLEFPEYFLVNVYTPNAGEELKRLGYRVEWDLEFLNYLKKLETKKPVIVCGDLNVAHQEIDLANPKANRGNPGFTDEERHGISRLLDSGFLDTFRQFNQEPGQYTWWTYRFGARLRNIGWRIDYFLVSTELRPILNDAFIRCEVLGSDHCPVGITLK